jgi:transcriptional regulator with XRE-family HTH domain
MDNYRIRKLVWNSGESYTKICKSLGIHSNSLERWCSGAVSPKADGLIKLSNYFGVSVDWILGLTNRKEINR